MTCPKCKGWVCYLCNESIDKKVGYGHFCQHPTDPGKPCTKCNKCALWFKNDKHFAEAERMRVESAGLEADASYRTEHASNEIQDELQVLAGVQKSTAKAKPKTKVAAKKSVKRKAEEYPSR